MTPTPYDDDTRERFERLMRERPDVARACVTAGDVLASYAHASTIEAARRHIDGIPAFALATCIDTPINGAVRALALIVAITDQLDSQGVAMQVQPVKAGEKGTFVVQFPDGTSREAASRADAAEIMLRSTVATLPREGYCVCGATLDADGHCTFGETPDA